MNRKLHKQPQKVENMVTSVPRGIVIFILAVTATPGAYADNFVDYLKKMSNPTSTANELSAKAELRKMMTAMEIYYAEHEAYPESIEALVAAGYLDEGSEWDEKNGYSFSLQSSADSFTIVAEPLACGKTGNRIMIATGAGKISETRCK